MNTRKDLFSILWQTQHQINESNIIALKSMQKRIERAELLIEDLYDKNLEEEPIKTGIEFGEDRFKFND